MISSKTSEKDRPEQTGPAYVTSVGPNDVLLGRGAPIINNEGNVRFRKVIADRKSQYIASSRNPLKNKIACEVLDEITITNKGRFLRKVEDIQEMKTLGIPSDTSAWVPVDETIALQKVKQALREHDKNTKGDRTKSDVDQSVTSETQCHEASPALPPRPSVPSESTENSSPQNTGVKGDEAQEGENSITIEQRLLALRLLQQAASEEQALRQQLLRALQPEQKPALSNLLGGLPVPGNYFSQSRSIQQLQQQQQQQQRYATSASLFTPELLRMLQQNQSAAGIDPRIISNTADLSMRQSLYREPDIRNANQGLPIRDRNYDEKQLLAMLHLIQASRTVNPPFNNATLPDLARQRAIINQSAPKSPNTQPYENIGTGIPCDSLRTVNGTRKRSNEEMETVANAAKKLKR